MSEITSVPGWGFYRNAVFLYLHIENRRQRARIRGLDECGAPWDHHYWELQSDLMELEKIEKEMLGKLGGRNE